MKPHTFAHLVGTSLYEHRFGPFFVTPIVIGLEDGKALVYNYDSIGTQSCSEPFSYIGTNGDTMASLCESFYKEGLQPEELGDTVGHILLGGIDSDILAGWGAIVYVMTENSIEAKYLKTKMV